MDFETFKSSLPTRIGSKIVEDFSGCWKWQGAKDSNGYGVVWFLGKLWRCHVVAWRVVYGATDVGKEIHHVCKDKACMNPGHLEQLTRAEHLRKEPSRSIRTTYMRARVLELRSSGYSVTEIAAALEVSRSTVHRLEHDLHGRGAKL